MKRECSTFSLLCSQRNFRTDINSSMGGNYAIAGHWDNKYIYSVLQSFVRIILSSYETEMPHFPFSLFAENGYKFING